MSLSGKSSLTGIVQKGSVIGLAGSRLSIFLAVVWPVNPRLSAQRTASDWGEREREKDKP